jgi:nicotinamidase-related amidase
MFVIENDKSLFVDVDDTLVIWEGTTYRPHTKHIELIKKFHQRGMPIIVWSAGGHAWALRIVKELQLEPYVTAVMSKPAWFVDDLPAEEFLPEINRIYLKDEHSEVQPTPITRPFEYFAEETDWPDSGDLGVMNE